MAGRLKLDGELQERVAGLLALGVPAVEACQSVGIDPATFKRWVVRGRNSRGAEYVAFTRAIDQARAQCEATLAQAVARSAKTSWRAAAWMLERQFSERWAASRPADRSGEAVPDAFAEFDQLAAKRAGRVSA